MDDVGNRWFIGQPISVYYDYVWDGIWQTSEAETAAKYSRKPGEIKVRDLDNSNSVNDADRQIIGTNQPDFVANMTNSFRYCGFDLSFELYCRWGHMIEAGIFSQECITNCNVVNVNYWTPENGSNEFPRPDENNVSFQQGSVLKYRDGSFIRLKNLSIGYTLPQALMKKLHLSRARIYLTGENLYTWSKEGLQKYNIDLENGKTFPIIRTYTLGLNLSF